MMTTLLVCDPRDPYVICNEIFIRDGEERGCGLPLGHVGRHGSATLSLVCRVGGGKCRMVKHHDGPCESYNDDPR